MLVYVVDLECMVCFYEQVFGLEGCVGEQKDCLLVWLDVFVGVGVGCLGMFVQFDYQVQLFDVIVVLFDQFVEFGVVDFVVVELIGFLYFLIMIVVVVIFGWFGLQVDVELGIVDFVIVCWFVSFVVGQVDVVGCDLWFVQVQFG